MKKRITSTVLLVFVIPFCGFAETPSADQLADRISPCIDAEVMNVVHLDLQRLDVQAIADRFAALFNSNSSYVMQGIAGKLHAATGFIKQLQIRECYLIYSLKFLMLGDFYPYLLIPVNGESHYWMISQITKSLNMVDGKSALINKKLMYQGIPEFFPHVKEITPAERPSLKQAFAAVADYEIKSIFIPPEYALRLTEHLSPRLPDALGGGSTALYTKGAVWAAFGLSLATDFKFKAVITSENEQYAGLLHEKIAGFIDALTVSPESSLPARALLKMITGEETATFASEGLKQLLTPERKGRRITLELGRQELSHIVKQVLFPLLMTELLNRVRNFKLESVQLASYAIQHYRSRHNKWPQSISDAVNSFFDGKTKPLRGENFLVYHQPAGNIKDLKNRIVLYPRFYEWPAKGLYAAFADGSVRLLTSEAEFKRLLKNPAPQPGKPPGNRR